MPILEKDKVKIYRPGDAVTATVVNDTIYTAIDARERAETAVSKATNAEGHSLVAKSTAETSIANSQNALSTAASALTNSEAAQKKSDIAAAKADTAFNTVMDLEDRANRGDFDGKDGDIGSIVTAPGVFGFQVLDDGHLWLTFFGDDAPDFHINENGELVLNI